MADRANMLFCTTPQKEVKIDVFFSKRVHSTRPDETLWLSQKQMAELFGTAKSTISEHLTNIFESGELDKDSTVRKFRTVQKEGKREATRNIDFYNLDTIIAVGYRVNSKQATQFCIWATKVLKEFIIKGFVLDDAFLEFNGYEILQNLGKVKQSVARDTALKHYENVRVK